MPSFASVNLPVASPEIEGFLQRFLPTDEFLHIPPIPYLDQIKQFLPYPDQLLRPFKFGRLWWPQGATRWATFHCVISEVERAAIDTVIYGGGYSPETLIITDSIGTISPSMWTLAARPISQIPKVAKWLLPQASLGTRGDPSYILTLVDDRYFWWQRAGTISIDVGTTTWAGLISSIASALNVTITTDSIPSAYLKPTAALKPLVTNLPVLLDMVAFSIGMRVIVNLDGTVHLQNAASALAAMNANLGASYPVLAGGVLSTDFQAIVGGYSYTDQPPMVPAAVQINFPEIAGGTPYQVSVDMTDCGLDSILFQSSVSTSGETMPIPSLQPYDGTNGAALATLATQAAKDFYSWTLGKEDISFAGIQPCLPHGLADAVEWILAGLADGGGDQSSTRIQSANYHGFPQTMPVPWTLTVQDSAMSPDIVTLVDKIIFGAGFTVATGGGTGTATVTFSGSGTTISTNYTNRGSAGTVTTGINEIDFDTSDGSIYSTSAGATYFWPAYPRSALIAASIPTGSGGTGYDTTSSSTVTIGGTMSFTVDAALMWVAGDIISFTNGTSILTGSVSSYDAGSGALVVTVTNTGGGSGTYSSWTFHTITLNIAGSQAMFASLYNGGGPWGASAFPDSSVGVVLEDNGNPLLAGAWYIVLEKPARIRVSSTAGQIGYPAGIALCTTMFFPMTFKDGTTTLEPTFTVDYSAGCIFITGASGTTVQPDVKDASFTQRGVVNLSNQTMGAGIKKFEASSTNYLTIDGGALVTIINSGNAGYCYLQELSGNQFNIIQNADDSSCTAFLKLITANGGDANTAYVEFSSCLYYGGPDSLTHSAKGKTYNNPSSGNADEQCTIINYACTFEFAGGAYVGGGFTDPGDPGSGFVNVMGNIHASPTSINWIQLPVSTFSGTVALAKLTPVTGTNGSLTVVNGVITAYSAPT